MFFSVQAHGRAGTWEPVCCRWSAVLTKNGKSGLFDHGLITGRAARHKQQFGEKATEQ
jgi:hypothetical protein